MAEDGSSPLMEGDKREDEVETVKASKEEKPDKGTAQSHLYLSNVGAYSVIIYCTRIT